MQVHETKREIEFILISIIEICYITYNQQPSRNTCHTMMIPQLPLTLPTIVICIIILILSCFDYGTITITRPVNGQQLHSLLHALKHRHPDYAINTVIDIGANAGKYSQTIRKLFPLSKIIMVEGSKQHLVSLQNFTMNDNGLSEYYITVLSNTDNEQVQFYENHRANTGNSMFRENSKHFQNLQPITKITKTIDTLVSESILFNSISTSTDDTTPVVDLIKADVQGAELLVFQGATKLLQQATFVQFEGSTIEWNDGGSCFYEIDTLLRSHGFFLYNMGDFHINPTAFKTTGVGQFDIMYVKPTSPRLPNTLKQLNGKFCGASKYTQPINDREVMEMEIEDDSVDVSTNVVFGPSGIEVETETTGSDSDSVSVTGYPTGSNSRSESNENETYLGFLYGVTFSLICYVSATSSTFKIVGSKKHGKD